MEIVGLLWLQQAKKRQFIPGVRARGNPGFKDLELPKIGGSLDKGYSILGSILGSLYFGKVPHAVGQFGLQSQLVLICLNSQYPLNKL